MADVGGNNQGNRRRRKRQLTAEEKYEIYLAGASVGAARSASPALLPSLTIIVSGRASTDADDLASSVPAT